jgi:hypothetical protein
MSDQSPPVIEIENFKKHYHRLNTLLRQILIPSKEGQDFGADETPLAIFKLINTSPSRTTFKWYDFFIESARTEFKFFAKPRVRLWRLLQNAGLLEGDVANTNFMAIVIHKQLGHLSLALEILNKHKQLTQTNFDAVISDPKPLNLANNLCGIQQITLASLSLFTYQEEDSTTFPNKINSGASLH